MNILLYGHRTKQLTYELLVSIVGQCVKHCDKVYIYSEFYREMVQSAPFPYQVNLISTYEEASDIDFLVSMGGDGTFLSAVAFAKGESVPILGINTGRLGFLSNVDTTEIAAVLHDLKSGEYTVEQRMLACLQSEQFPPHAYALNDIMVHRTDVSGMIAMDVWVDGVFLNSYWGDGLIISTPTGSTAYSLSCGGPILDPDMEAFVITPIASHTLTVRPIVIAAHKEIKIKVSSRTDDYMLSKDSDMIKVSTQADISIVKADKGVKVVRLHNRDFYTIISEKLMWGVDKRKLSF